MLWAKELEVGIIMRNWGAGLPISVETCPHYLNFVSQEVPEGDTRFKCAPPIRGAANQAALWEGLLNGHIDSLASDHSPSPVHMKLLEAGDFDAAWGGIAGNLYYASCLFLSLVPKIPSEGSRPQHAKEVLTWQAKNTAGKHLVELHESKYRSCYTLHSLAMQDFAISHLGADSMPHLASERLSLS